MATVELAFVANQKVLVGEEEKKGLIQTVQMMADGRILFDVIVTGTDGFMESRSWYAADQLAEAPEET